MHSDPPHIHVVIADNDEDSLVDLIYKALEFDCIDLLEFECFKKFGHDRLTQLSPAEERHIVMTCRPKVARRAMRAGYQPVETDRLQ